MAATDGQSNADYGFHPAVKQAEPVKENILQEADRITAGARQEAYDDPLPSHQRIAALWGEYLDGKYGQSPPIQAEDVAWMMILLKIARDMHSPSRDSLVDVAGYARCIERIRAMAGGGDCTP